MSETNGHELPTVAVILAGGTGQRVGLSLPKQLIKVAGKPIIQQTLEVFDGCPVIDEIIVLMAPGYLADAQKIVADAALTKVTQVIEGGASRSDTTQRALAAIGDRDCNVLLHDAVRPFVDHSIIKNCVKALTRYEAIDVAIPSADTIIAVADVDGDEQICDVPARSTLRRGQTPQGFRISVLRRAYELASADPDFTATDDCGVVRHYLPDVPIYVVPGTENNFKVTHPIDVYLADRLFQLAARPAPTHETEAARSERLTGRTAVVFGGSYGIGASIVELLEANGATVFSFSRSTTGTHVERSADVTAALAEAHDKTGRVDFVINTAGVLRIGALAEIDEADIDEAINVNYLAPVHIARTSLRYLRETSGSLLLFTSSSYTRGRANYSLYSSTKAAVVNLTQALADEWSDIGVRVNCVNPERTSTPMRTRAFGEEPATSLLSAEAVAETSVDVLLSDITGAIVDVRRIPEPRAEQPSTMSAEAELDLDITDLVGTR